MQGVWGRAMEGRVGEGHAGETGGGVGPCGESGGEGHTGCERTYVCVSSLTRLPCPTLSRDEDTLIFSFSLHAPICRVRYGITVHTEREAEEEWGRVVPQHNHNIVGDIRYNIPSCSTGNATLLSSPAHTRTYT